VPAQPGIVQWLASPLQKWVLFLSARTRYSSCGRIVCRLSLGLHLNPTHLLIGFSLQKEREYPGQETKNQQTNALPVSIRLYPGYGCKLSGG
jgi:hypothetical protein